MSDEQAEVGRLRASTADRERVAAVLSTAMAEGRITVAELEERLGIVYGATTLADLAPVTRDLPVPAGWTPPPLAPATSEWMSARAGGRVGGVATSSWALAMMAGAQRTGEWVVPRQFNVVAFMGGVELDLTQARLAAPEVTISALAFMGGVQIIVPDDIVVVATGIGFMGGFDHVSAGYSARPSGSPVVRVNGLAFMGGVEIRRPKRNRVTLQKS